MRGVKHNVAFLPAAVEMHMYRMNEARKKEGRNPTPEDTVEAVVTFLQVADPSMTTEDLQHNYPSSAITRLFNRIYVKKSPGKVDDKGEVKGRSRNDPKRPSPSLSPNSAGSTGTPLSTSSGT